MTEIKRYSPDFMFDLEMVVCGDGEFVAYEDHAAIVSALQEQVRAQQQKVVELPEPVKWPEIPFKYFSEEQVFSMLDSAGVKWEVKK